MNTVVRLAGLLLSLGLISPARADRLPLPADTPEAYRSECGACHLPFPPALLAAGDWQRTLAGLDRHFGTEASLEPRTREALAVFLERHAGRGDRLADAGDPPRLTRSRWFRREHREIPGRLWSDTRVKSAANCEACHQGAAQGRFSEHDLLLPELKRRER